MIILDGSYMEGGGQIVRTALALSTLTGKPFKVENIRKGRKDSGLKAQHLHAIKALKKISGARTNDVSIGSEYLEFYPGNVNPGKYKIDIGTAGSISLILQALIPPLIFAGGESRLRIIGGSTGKWATPVEYLKNVFLPFIGRLGDIEAAIVNEGYYPKGGGIVDIGIMPRFSSIYDIKDADRYDLTERKGVGKIHGISHASLLLKGAKAAERQADSAKKVLGDCDIEIKYHKSRSPGSGIVVWAEFENCILGGDSLGERGKRAEDAGEEAGEELKEAIESCACADRHTADQILPFMAFLPGSRVRVSEVTKHARTNAYVIEKFLGVKFSFEGNIISVLRS